MKSTIIVATAGQGMLRSNDNGATWHRLGLGEPIEFDGIVRSLAVDPKNPQRIYAGADCGVCISENAGAHWRRANGPIQGMTVWSLAVDPNDPTVLYAGTGAPSRAALFKSTDSGETFTRVVEEFPEFCAGVNRPRLLTICVDPDDGRQVWFGLEEGGVWRSNDAGATWVRLDGADQTIRHSDIHAIAIASATPSAPKTTFVLTVNTAYRSVDDGQTWSGEPSKERFEGLYYTRTILPLPGNGNDLLLAIGDGTPGIQTRIYRSADRGESWELTNFKQTPNSTVWAFGAHAADANLIYAGTKYGNLFVSRDAGRTWEKEWRDFSEITAVAWTPVAAPLKAHAKSDV
ncbi:MULTISPECIES: glycosyl hydrolase [Rhodopseudomonas]|uniref:Glycosyl hydrolase n=1 Tax=Rhodopseudomonas palustris TaxID=1076 RepID=A0A0D7F408_RHOPL|nr:MULTISPECIES: glycosyl hydrolase [Rhodopseudomonas]KIZ47794.1 glycosyl hydrolase [Rhodopseudomonas palustris]MDF3811017.1 hypothetical protein [Rhodopseudomonas sp. BAL398]WOK15915.1 hypothetical protein RBJ75_17265 [Rhodopseudomonas sp. BAL398]